VDFKVKGLNYHNMEVFELKKLSWTKWLRKSSWRKYWR
jgi:hypothetical protein